MTTAQIADAPAAPHPDEHATAIPKGSTSHAGGKHASHFSGGAAAPPSTFPIQLDYFPEFLRKKDISQSDAFVYIGGKFVARIVDSTGRPLHRDHVPVSLRECWFSAADNFLQRHSVDGGIRHLIQPLDQVIEGARGVALCMPASTKTAYSPSAHGWLTHPKLVETLRRYCEDEFGIAPLIACDVRRSAKGKSHVEAGDVRRGTIHTSHPGTPPVSPSQGHSPARPRPLPVLYVIDRHDFASITAIHNYISLNPKAHGLWDISTPFPEKWNCEPLPLRQPHTEHYAWQMQTPERLAS